MVNLVRIGPSNADDDPQIEAARQQVALAMAEMQRGGPSAGVPLAEGHGAIQAKYGMGNALIDVANKLAQGFALGQAQKRYGDLKDQQDASLTASNQQKLDALAPPTTPGAQVPVPMQLDAVPQPGAQFQAPDLSAGGGMPNGPVAPPAPDQPVTMTPNAAIPAQINPAHEQVANALAGMDPRTMAATLTGLQLRNAVPDPAVVESQKLREATLAQTAADREAGRSQQLGLANQADQTRRDLANQSDATRRDLAREAAAAKAGTDADAQEGMRDRAAKIVAYEAAPPSGMGSNSPQTNALWKAIHDEEARTGQKYDATKYNYYNAGRRAFTSGTQSNTIRSLDVAVRHMDTLEGMVDALKNKDFRAFNILGNAAGVQMGDTPVTNYEMGANILGKEVEKSLISNGGTGQERNEAVAKFGSNGSPQQMHQGFGVARTFLNGQLKGLLRQGSAATGWDEGRLRQELQLPDTLSERNLNSPGGSAPPAKTQGGATVSNW